jgi:hypothetical protein
VPIVTAVALSINHVEGVEVSKRLEAAMVAEVLACTADGISTSEEHAAVLKARLLAAHDRELAAILAERG